MTDVVKTNLIINKLTKAKYNELKNANQIDETNEVYLLTDEMLTKTETETALSGKQDTLEFDDEPTANSTKSLTSGAVAAALESVASASSINIIYE